MSRLAARFAVLKNEGRKALVCYVTAGHPDPVACVALIRGIAAAGADVIEVGVPFSDPMADGPVIQQSSQIALGHGVNLDRTLAIVQEAAVEVPIVLFSYLNPVIAGGTEVLARARAAGVDGMIITDLPVGADPAREQWFGASGLDFVRLVAPTTPAARMAGGTVAASFISSAVLASRGSAPLCRPTCLKPWSGSGRPPRCRCVSALESRRRSRRRRPQRSGMAWSLVVPSCVRLVVRSRKRLLSRLRSARRSTTAKRPPPRHVAGIWLAHLGDRVGQAARAHRAGGRPSVGVGQRHGSP
jgi:tryptophan synthase alpha chain